MGTQAADNRRHLHKRIPVLQNITWRSSFSSVDIAALAYFRIAFGMIMLWEVWRYFEYNWIERYWLDPILHFTYYGFDWVQPWPGEGMYWHFMGLGILAAFITLGLWYRISSALFFIAFAYVFLLEKARYLNHFYLICLISFLLIFIPAHRAFSIDAWLDRNIRSDNAPAWALWILQLQIGIPYFYGGVAKLNGDWLQGEPMRIWMAERTDFPLIGPLFTDGWMVYLLSYGGLLLDLSVVPLLLWRRTRPWAFAVAVVFHLMNARLFSIGIFPWFMIAATTMFFRPDWPRRLFGQQRFAISRNQSATRLGKLRPKQVLMLTMLGIYLALQLLIPLRHYLYPGNVSWTEEGHRFAWHMKLRSKKANVLFVVINQPDNTMQLIDPSDFLPSWQVDKMAARPDMILQFSHFLVEQFSQAEADSVDVRAVAYASLNGREYQHLIDPNVDLSRQSQRLRSASWIVPLEIPLSSRLTETPSL